MSPVGVAPRAVSYPAPSEGDGGSHSGLDCWRASNNRARQKEPSSQHRYDTRTSLVPGVHRCDRTENRSVLIFLRTRQTIRNVNANIAIARVTFIHPVLNTSLPDVHVSLPASQPSGYPLDPRTQ